MERDEITPSIASLSLNEKQDSNLVMEDNSSKDLKTKNQTQEETKKSDSKVEKTTNSDEIKTEEKYIESVLAATYLIMKLKYEYKVKIGKMTASSMESELPKFKMLKPSDIEQIREYLKSTLTTLKFDPSEDFNDLMEKILKYETKSVQFTKWSSLKPVSPKWKVAVWKGDITTLEVDCIVNAANSYMLGCFTPNHPCIDNVIHCKSGPRLRAACREIMSKQNGLEPTGIAKLTKAYCLPSKYVLHTVGPIAKYPGHKQPRLLASCYKECLRMSKENGIRSIAFCCISTGVFGYPQQAAAEVALKTVKEWLSKEDNAKSVDLIIFNVFTPKDHEIYQDLAPGYFD